MIRRLSFASFVCVAACASPPPPAPAPSLIGHWTPFAAELGGRDYPITNFQGRILRVTAVGYEYGQDKGSYSVIANTSPAQIDIRGESGPNAGRTILAIHELAGDRLTVCYQLDRQGPRPMAFESPANTMVMLVRYQRSP